MTRSASVVIIGAGVVGVSIAYHLARKGERDVLVLDAKRIGSGSTGKATGGIRQQFATEINVRLSQLSLPFFLGVADELGTPIDFHPIGYLLLATTDATAAKLRENVALQQRLGVDVRLLGPADLPALVPHLRTDDVRLASFCPSDGYADPHQVTQALATTARRLGVAILEETPVLAIEASHGRVGAVVTLTGRIATEVVVVAAGPWARPVGRMAGLDLPVEPIRRHNFVTGPLPEVGYTPPLTIDLATSAYFRREGPGILIGGGEEREQHGFDDAVDWDVLREMADRAVSRLPVLAGASFHRGWAGLREITPDQHAILGPVPQPAGLYLAVGFSGHGFMHAPATGRLIADLMLDGGTALDLTPLRPERFDRLAAAEFRSSFLE